MGRHPGLRPLLWVACALLCANTGATDLDDLKARHVVRLLVVYSKTFYFFDGAQTRGISYEFGNAFERRHHTLRNSANTSVSAIGRGRFAIM